MNNMLGLMQH